VVFRKVTNGFRCEWGAETYAAIRSGVETAKANAASALQVLKAVLLASNPTVPQTDPG
jgi:transposase